MITRMAFRNLFRQKRRSLLTLLTLVGGYALCSLSLGFADGSYGTIIDMFTRSRVGHVQIHAAGYLNKPSLYATMPDADSIGAKTSGIRYVVSWAPRVYSGALAFIGEKTAGIQVVGVDPFRESATTTLPSTVTNGRFLSSDPSDDVVLTYGLARVFNANAGDEIALIAQGVDGSIANGLFRVVGLAGDPRDVFDRTAYLHIASAQQWLALGKRVHEVAVVLTDQRRSRVAARLFEAALADESLDVQPWQVVESQFYNAMEADAKGNWISLGIIMVIVAIGVLNTILMTILERTREFAVLRALGTRPSIVFRLVVTETAWLSALAVVVGGVIGAALNHYWAEHGIHLGDSAIEYGGAWFDTIYGAVSFQSVWVPAVLTIGTALLVSFLPALRAARMAPARGLRAH